MFPLYVVFATVAIPTFLLWRFGPKPVKPGHRRCGYNLTGNTSGVCSECGVEVQAWGGCTLCVLIAVTFVASAWWQVAFQVPTSRGPAMYVVAGSVMFVTDNILSVPVSVAQSGYGLSRWNGWGGEFWRYLELPLYAVFAAVAVPTLLVWRFWPKPIKPGHCRCGYDLTGNVSGTCPECGVEVQS